TKAIGEANVMIEDNCFSIDDIIAQVDYLVKEKKVEVVLVDYLQMIKVKSRRDNNREADVAKVCRELKALARKYNIVVVVNSQLSRAVETRGGDKRPQLSDLRESGSIEQDADKVLFIHRPEYYNITEDENGMSTEGIAEIIIAKDRDGAIGSVKLNFVGQCSTYKDLNSSYKKVPHYGAEYFKEIRKDEFKQTIDKVVQGSKMNDIDEDHPF
ncbi:MAG: DnaB-like helicase C-terminal domain-containing protein, partial [Bacteroidetes bacterium]|nr:DnaB-like helicase C-terminal domain-containing protein [Bacteroidota bacterium]